MVMDQFVTTYRKDYLWPYVKTLGVRPQPDRLYQPQYNDPNRPNYPCECHAIGDPQATNQQLCSLLGPQAYEEESWSRVGPMGPLLDPKIYPAKVSSAPETQISRFNQPNVFLAKLQEKYPFIYECLRTAPPDDLLARINRDRLRSTYQVDFCKMKMPSGTRLEMIIYAQNDVSPPCPGKDLHCGNPCKPLSRNKALRMSTISKQFMDSNMPSERNSQKSCERGITAWNPFESDPKTCTKPPDKWQLGRKSFDVIDTWGHMIYRESPKQHHRLR
ncbi:uncharacterized protein LOC109533751 isoform X2 [Dendroctonus ponderosae]|uniref:uncharacterized protein LOC109533751 isoform X2 n=1 Tax=Dendroctonus ponderosae TaxID=77166 RepID=UPI00203624FF|nr:uncharacterized protein LOC109533751 isoform X2 [Dendroctonus ponderosae]